MANNRSGSATRPGLIFVAIVLVLGLIGGVFGTGFSGVVLHQTSDTEFCVSCHVYDDFAERFKTTSHWNNASGVRAGCGDCHIPEHSWWAMIREKAYMGTKDVWQYFVGGIDTPEEFRQHRERLRQTATAWFVANDSITCRSCHEADAMQLDAQGPGARGAHQVLGTPNAPTCVACHGGIAHPGPESDGGDGESTAAADGPTDAS